MMFAYIPNTGGDLPLDDDDDDDDDSDCFGSIEDANIPLKKLGSRKIAFHTSGE